MTRNNSNHSTNNNRSNPKRGFDDAWTVEGFVDPRKTATIQAATKHMTNTIRSRKGAGSDKLQATSNLRVVFREWSGGPMRSDMCRTFASFTFYGRVQQGQVFHPVTGLRMTDEQVQALRVDHAVNMALNAMSIIGDYWEAGQLIQQANDCWTDFLPLQNLNEQIMALIEKTGIREEGTLGQRLSEPLIWPLFNSHITPNPRDGDQCWVLNGLDRILDRATVLGEREIELLAQEEAAEAAAAELRSQSAVDLEVVARAAEALGQDLDAIEREREIAAANTLADAEAHLLAEAAAEVETLVVVDDEKVQEPEQAQAQG